MSAPRPADLLRTLQAVRLAGFADEEALADRALLGEDALRATLATAAATGQVEDMRFAESRGWILTDIGQESLSALLGDEVAAADARDVLISTITAFEQPRGINARFVEIVSRWQLRSTAEVQEPYTADAPHDVAGLLADLATLGRQLRADLADLITRLPRFGRYPAQYDLAARRAATDGLGWVTGVGILSCHVVWAELHQDLRSTVGGDSPTDPGGRR